MDLDEKNPNPTEPESAAVEVDSTVFDEIVAATLETDGKTCRHDKKKHKIRKLCKLVKKDFMDDHFEEYRTLVADSKWVCKECGRASNDPARLHAPISLENAEEEAPSA